MENLLSSTIGQNSFWMVNKKIAKYLKSNDAALFLSDLISKRDYFKSKNQLDENGGFFCLSQNLEDELNITKEARQKIIVQLKKIGLLKVVKKGLPSKNYYYIQDNNIINILNTKDLNDLALEEETSKKSNDFQSAENTAQYKIEKPAQYRAENPATNKNKETRIKENREREISQEDVYRKWLSEIEDVPVYQRCYEELLVLFESLKSCGVSSEDIMPSFKRKVLARWSKSKYPERQLELWDKAFGATFNSDIELSVPELKEPKGVKVKSYDGQITIDTALKLTSPDDEIEKMMREYEEIMNRDRVDVFDDEDDEC